MDSSSFLRFASLQNIPDLSHAVVARPNNLAPHTGPECGLAVPRRRDVCASLGLDFDRLTCPRQVHGVRVARVDAANAGAGRDGRESTLADCDGVMTDLPGVPLIAFGADCCLLTVVDPAAHAVGLLHAGWRGVAAGGAVALIERMRQAYGARPERMLAAIGPAALPCCYEISDDLAAQLAASAEVGGDMLRRCGNRWHLDMHATLARQLNRGGLSAERIERMGLCTICDERFFSYRREGASTGRNAVVIGWTR